MFLLYDLFFVSSFDSFLSDDYKSFYDATIGPAAARLGRQPTQKGINWQIVNRSEIREQIKKYIRHAE